MHFSSRSRMSKTFSLVSIAVILGMLLAAGTLLNRGIPKAYAASSNGVHAVAGKAVKAVTVNPLKLAKVTNAASTHYAIPILSTHASSSTAARSGNAPHAAAIALTGSSTQVLHNFNGVSSVDSLGVNGLDVEPPDQGLCTGKGYVVEPVNLALTIFRSNGTVVAGPVALPAFFGEPPVFTPPDVNIQGDVRCYYDPPTHTFFATQIFLTTALTNNVSHFDVAVNNSGNPTTPWTIYKFDTTNLTDPGCPCLGDQPLFGIDQNNIYISTNEFSISAVTGGAVFFNGAQIYAISKSQLVALSSTVNFVHFGNLGIGGTIAASVEPAITVDKNAKAEYFLNSLDPFGTFDNRVGVWALTNGKVVSTRGIPNLSNTVITSEAYGFPPPAETPVGFNSGVPGSTSGFIQTDDDRMLQVQFINGQLWSTLTTALTIPGETGVRSGAAWFEIRPSLNGNIIGKSTVTKQGYVSVTGNYLLYPAVVANQKGSAAMVMTLSGPNTFPSAVFAVLRAGSRQFGTIHIAASGVTANTGVTAVGGPGRWGDYSAAVIDPNGSGGIWMATEYIPGAGSAFANWGTRVLEVQP
jgi:hypothetical protein